MSQNPDEDIYKLTPKLGMAEPGEILYIDDKEKYVCHGKKAGLMSQYKIKKKIFLEDMVQTVKGDIMY